MQARVARYEVPPERCDEALGRLRPARPFLCSDRVELVVLPDACDLQVAQREPFLTEARLLEHADRSEVPRGHGRLNAVEPELAEGGVDSLPDRLRRVAAP